MSSQLLTSLIKQSESLTVDEKLSLANYLTDKAKIEKESARVDLSKQSLAVKQKLSTQWIKQHQSEYAEQYVALEGDSFIACAKTRCELMELLRKEGKANLFITFVPDPEKVYWGGF